MYPPQTDEDFWDWIERLRQTEDVRIFMGTLLQRSDLNPDRELLYWFQKHFGVTINIVF